MTAPASLTYDSLTSDILSYTEKPNSPTLKAQVPRLIMLAENRIATDLRILGTQIVVSGAFTPNNPVIDKPAMWRRTTSFRYTNADGKLVELFLRQYEYCREYWPNPSRTTSAPKFYSDYNISHLLVVGTPAAGYEFELNYVGRLPPLSSANQTNWYTDGAPQLILSASLLETEIWLKNQTRIGQRQTSYDGALTAFKSEDASRAFDRSIVLM